jgi:hypothetical protein
MKNNQHLNASKLQRKRLQNERSQYHDKKTKPEPRLIQIPQTRMKNNQQYWFYKITNNVEF